MMIKNQRWSTSRSRDEENSPQKRLNESEAENRRLTDLVVRTRDQKQRLLKASNEANASRRELEEENGRLRQTIEELCARSSARVQSLQQELRTKKRECARLREDKERIDRRLTEEETRSSRSEAQLASVLVGTAASASAASSFMDGSSIFAHNLMFDDNGDSDGGSAGKSPSFASAAVAAQVQASASLPRSASQSQGFSRHQQHSSYSRSNVEAPYQKGDNDRRRSVNLFTRSSSSSRLHPPNPTVSSRSQGGHDDGCDGGGAQQSSPQRQSLQKQQGGQRQENVPTKPDPQVHQQQNCPELPVTRPPALLSPATRATKGVAAVSSTRKPPVRRNFDMLYDPGEEQFREAESRTPVRPSSAAAASSFATAAATAATASPSSSSSSSVAHNHGTAYTCASPSSERKGAVAQPWSPSSRSSVSWSAHDDDGPHARPWKGGGGAEHSVAPPGHGQSSQGGQARQQHQHIASPPRLARRQEEEEKEESALSAARAAAASTAAATLGSPIGRAGSSSCQRGVSSRRSESRKRNVSDDGGGGGSGDDDDARCQGREYSGVGRVAMLPGAGTQRQEGHFNFLKELERCLGTHKPEAIKQLLEVEYSFKLAAAKQKTKKALAELQAPSSAREVPACPKGGGGRLGPLLLKPQRHLLFAGGGGDHAPSSAGSPAPSPAPSAGAVAVAVAAASLLGRCLHRHGLLTSGHAVHLHLRQVVAPRLVPQISSRVDANSGKSTGGAVSAVVESEEEEGAGVLVSEAEVARACASARGGVLVVHDALSLVASGTQVDAQGKKNDGDGGGRQQTQQRIIAEILRFMESQGVAISDDSCGSSSSSSSSRKSTGLTESDAQSGAGVAVFVVSSGDGVGRFARGCAPLVALVEHVIHF